MRYKVDRLNLITYRNQRKKEVYNTRSRYLAKSQIVNCVATNKEFTYTNFRGSRFKKVSFNGSKLFGCDFWGASFNNCSFRNTKISDCVFMACRFKNCDFSGAVFNYTTIVNTALNECKNIDISNGVTLYPKYPQGQHNPELDAALELLKNNSTIRKHKLLHLPGNKFNELNLFLLQRRYSMDELPQLLIEFNNRSLRNMTTYKKMERELNRIKNMV